MFTRKSLEKPVFLYLIIVLGACILSFGLYNIHERTGVTEGGVLGMTLLLQHWFGLSPAITSPVMDIACYLLAWHFLGNAFAKYAVAASLAFAASHALWEQFPPLLPDLSAFPMAAAILGALFVGLGVGLVVRIGGACGGDDALALTIAHVSRWPISRCYLFTDLAVLLLSLTYIPFARIVYSLVTVTISSVVIGRVQRLGVRAPEGETAVDA
ncbi:YitT family protein [Intestinimonas massiliensis]|uniref:YitT family protein n=1 Tax=Intestinimonas massiliensis (ex Afouda et al. 2020) TaxID=1673721 RepID=A0ABS9MBK7_9FIRM|nr:YitT family protein [Intestinimonas massiliensis (ex Afouda et al. 2020)]MCG4528199.1 YitT family protein [Intestinimonas massiliensis (ex Afouda et al. 2020)]MCQ4805425.1 YitT family protein [Intestinimonas massiliensis (ex Afouda et al. 2020)]